MSLQIDGSPQPPASLAVPGPTDTARGDLGRLILVRSLSALRRRRLLVAACALLTTLATLVGSKLLARQTWEVEAMLLYAPLPVAEDEKGLYVPPDLKTLSAIVNNLRNLEKVRAEFKLDVPVKAIDKNLTATIPNGTKALKLAFRWDDGPKATAMLDRITDAFIDQVAELRRAKLADHIKDFEVTLRDAQARQDAAAKDVQEFQRHERLSDYRNDTTASQNRCIELEALLGQERRNLSDNQVQIDRMAEHLEEVKAEHQKEVEAEKQFQASAETVADNRRRQDRLRELILEERRVKEVQVKIEAKRREHERVRKLIARGAASQSELDQIQAELSVLNAELNDGEKIRQWQAELEKIDQVVVPEGAKKNVGSPIIQQVLFRKLELELQHSAILNQVSQIEQEIQVHREKLERLDLLRGQFESLERKVQTADAERLRLEGLISGMRSLQNLKAAEFVIADRPETPSYPLSTNRKILLLELGGGGILATLALVAALEFASARRSCAASACRLGLSSIAQVAPEGDTSRCLQLRGLSLRLRQYLPEPGAVVVFSTLSERGLVNPTLHELAALLALRDERVLILDARLAGPAPAALEMSPSELEALADLPTDPHGLRRSSLSCFAERLDPSNPGLSDYLTFATDNIDEICYPTENFGVDRISAGRAEVSPDTLATHRMSELVAKLRERYSILLVIAPPLRHSVDLQILAPHAQGIIAVVDSPAPVLREVRRTLTALRELGAPILGQVVLSDPRPE